MKDASDDERPAILEGGPIAWIAIGALQGRRAARGVAVAVLVGWAPLLVLAAIGGAGMLPALLSDFGVHARFLIAAPILVLADAVCAPRLAAIAWHFRDAGLVRTDSLPAFESAMAGTRDLARSVAAGALSVALAYAIVVVVAVSASPGLVPAWHRAGAGYSMAGMWHYFVSLPLLLTLFVAWIWRILLWSRLLRKIAALDLQLVPVHPDGAAGLLFVGYSVRALSVIAFAVGSIGAGSIANDVVRDGGHVRAGAAIVVIMLAAVLVLCAAPPLAFSGKLLRAWRRGIFHYGALAGRVGDAFERKWFTSGAAVDDTALQVQDYSATTDLYQVVSNVYRMRFAPVDMPSLLLLVGAVLAPLLPVALVALPADVMLAALKDLLF